MKLSLAFLAGAILNTTVIFFSPGKPALLVFLGAALSLASVGALLWLAGVRRAARFLNAFMDALEGTEPVRTKSRVVSGKDKNPWGWVKPSAKQQRQNVEDTIEEYLEAKETAGVGRVQ